MANDIKLLAADDLDTVRRHPHKLEPPIVLSHDHCKRVDCDDRADRCFASQLLRKLESFGNIVNKKLAIPIAHHKEQLGRAHCFDGCCFNTAYFA
jgi:hypothetical protein